MDKNEIIIEEVEAAEVQAASEVVEEVACDACEDVALDAAPVKVRKRRGTVKKSGLIERKWSIDRILVFLLFTAYSITLLGGVGAVLLYQFG